MEDELTLVEDSLLFQVNLLCKGLVLGMAISNEPQPMVPKLQNRIFQYAYTVNERAISSECWELERKKTRSNPVSTICTKQPSPISSDQVIGPVKDEGKNPFVSEGYVSLTENGEAVPIGILRDTGATQSLLVEGILPLSKEMLLEHKF